MVLVNDSGWCRGVRQLAGIRHGKRRAVVVRVTPRIHIRHGLVYVLAVRINGGEWVEHNIYPRAKEARTVGLRLARRLLVDIAGGE